VAWLLQHSSAARRLLSALIEAITMNMISDTTHAAHPDAAMADSELSHLRCVKTKAGYAQIRHPELALSRAARDLLFIIDGARSVADWLALVHGATVSDFDRLRTQGLIETTSSAAGLDDAYGDDPLGTVTYDDLYKMLTAQAKTRLGLIKGYKLILALEKCTTLAELRQLAQRFVVQVSKENDEASLDKLRTALNRSARQGGPSGSQQGGHRL
jgi:hypothetical protein